MKTRLLISILFLSFVVVRAQLPKVVKGEVQRIDLFQSHYVSPRNVDVWLPEGYSPKKKYAVLYMHDGQMLYDPKTTWNKQAWNVDDVVSKLLAKGQLRDMIVVGVWNGGETRHADYFPQKPFESIPDDQKERIYQAARTNGHSVFGAYKVQSDNYLKFLVGELKPYIDSAYATRPEREHTFVAGSSMGGLISMYALCEYPEVFGGAACLSTHWPGIFEMNDNPIPPAFVEYLRNELPDPATVKLYFDYGDATLDALYPPLQKMVDTVMVEKGFGPENWQTRFFPGEEHSEKAWNKRLDIPLKFLLAK